MNEYWILVADSGKARIFSRNKKFSALEELETLVHPESRLRRQDLVSDRPGQVQESRTPGESVNEEPTDPKVVEAQLFAREIAARLRKARSVNAFRHLVVVADPRFLGLIRANLDEETGNRIVASLAKNVTREATERIQHVIDRELRGDQG
jgi:protein required for attachment to host cells